MRRPLPCQNETVFLCGNPRFENGGDLGQDLLHLLQFRKEEHGLARVDHVVDHQVVMFNLFVKNRDLRIAKSIKYKRKEKINKF